MPADTKPYDVVLFGATGFTGTKIAEYLTPRMPEGSRWAIAGRNRPKLERLRERLSAAVDIVEADVDDYATIVAMARRARVLVTTVGPFSEYGDPVARACVEAGTDYVDSTGEAAFVNLLLERYAQEAARKRLRIVPSCGFDSVATDLGALHAIEQTPTDGPVDLRGYVSVKTYFSGGTQQSLVAALQSQAQAISAWREPTTDLDRKVVLSPGKLHKTREPRGWATPVPMICAASVVRSAAANRSYGPSFTYSHHMLYRTLPVALAVLVAVAVMNWVGQFALVRSLLRRLVRKSGYGPADTKLDRAQFAIHFVAESNGNIVRTKISGGDPSYREAAKMLGESALCLAFDRDALPPHFGVLTPAEAMGPLLLRRLQSANLHFGGGARVSGTES